MVFITLVIIAFLFSVQHAGTSKIGKAFGPVMLTWFSFLGVAGLLHILSMPSVLRAFNPVYAVQVLLSPNNKVGFMILGSVFLRQIVQDLQESGELPAQDRRYSIYGPSTVGSFTFCIIHKSVTTKTELSSLDELVLHIKYAIRKVAGSKTRWYGLDTSSLILEHVPLITGGGSGVDRIRRIYPT